MSLKICMIGCGAFARQCHGPAQLAYRGANPDAELAACCDADPARARDYAGTFGFGRSYSDAQAMLSAERPDAVVMAVPPEAACAAACPVLERGFPLLLEKPPGMTPAELERLIAALAKGGGRAQVAFNRRYMPVVRRALEILAGAFPPGSVEQVDYEMIRLERWDPDFSTTAIHALDAALLLGGSPFRSAEIQYKLHRSGAREAADVALEARCQAGPRARRGSGPSPRTTRNPRRSGAPASRWSSGYRSRRSPGGDGSVEHWRDGRVVALFSDRDVGAVDRLGVRAETEAFLGAVRSGGPLYPRPEDCRQQVALMEAIRARRPGPIDFESL